MHSRLVDLMKTLLLDILNNSREHSGSQNHSSYCRSVFALFIHGLIVMLFFCFLDRPTKKRYLLAAWKSMRLLHLFLMQMGIMRQSTATAQTITSQLNQWPCLWTISPADLTTLLDRLYILNARQ